MAQEPLPPPPVRQPIMDKNGQMAVVWQGWFKRLFERSGGSTPDVTLADLEEQLAYDQDAPQQQDAQVTDNTNLLATILDLPPRPPPDISPVETSSAYDGIMPPISAIMSRLNDLYEYVSSLGEGYGGWQRALSEVQEQLAAISQEQNPWQRHANFNKLTVSASAPPNPIVNDLWVDIS